MIVRPASNADVGFVLEHLREHCRLELFASRQAGDSVADLGLELELLAPMAIVRYALLPGSVRQPAAIFAAYRASAAVAMFQTFSTPFWPEVAAAFIPWFNKSVAPQLLLAGIHMAEFHVLETQDFNARWFELMHARPWGRALPRGRRGELFVPMVWLPPARVDAAAGDAGSAPTPA